MYYILKDNGSYYEDSGNIKKYASLPENVHINIGNKVELQLDKPLVCEMCDDWGKDPMLYWGSKLHLMHQDLLGVFLDMGVTNLQNFDAVIKNPYTGKDLTEYKVVNVVGRIDIDDFFEPEFMKDAPLVFLIGIISSELVMHESIHKVLSEKFPSLKSPLVQSYFPDKYSDRF